MNSLSTPTKISLLLGLVFMMGCQSLRTRDDVRRDKQPGASPTGSTSQAQPTTPGAPRPPTYNVPPYNTPSEDVTEAAPVELPPPPAPEIPKMPKLGIILGGGGAKTYAHIGFLHELAKAKVPVHAISGIEFAAPMAALYAQKEQANDVEWQMFKLKEDEVIKKSLLGSTEKNGQVTDLKGFISTAFNRVKAEDFRLPFGCPSLSLKKNQVFVMNRGGMDSVLSFCMAYPPYFRPYQGNVAGLREVSALAQYLRSKGANHIIFVNVLPAPNGSKNYVSDANSTDNVLWNEIASSYSKPFNGVDTVLNLDSGDYGIVDFERRREIMNRGADSASRQLKTLARKWGF